MLNLIKKYFSTENVITGLQIGAIALFSVAFINVTWPMITTLINMPFSFGNFFFQIFAYILRLLNILFEPLVLLAFAEMIKALKKGN